jgi:hypothetical protein
MGLGKQYSLAVILMFEKKLGSFLLKHLIIVIFEDKIPSNLSPKSDVNFSL